MTDIKRLWKEAVFAALESLASSLKLESDIGKIEALVAEYPPKPELGDIGFPLFGYAKLFRKSPAVIADHIEKLLEAQGDTLLRYGRPKAEGPYLNIFLDRASVIADVLARGDTKDWNSSLPFAGRRVMVEFSCPNTNKPLHLGHLRNNVLGESLSRILKAAGAEVKKVNLINDRGIHICKSMLAYQVYGGGRSPEDEGLKSDHFVGKYYVLFNQLKKEDPKAEEKAQELLRLWESGDEETLKLWKRMNQWAVEGIKTTYARQGVGFDDYYFESLTYTRGKAEVMDGLARHIFYRDEDGSIWVDLEDLGMDKKVLLRKDGTSIYITQDIGTAIQRSRDWPFDELVYVVASEQHYHFRALFEILRRLGYAWSENLFHLAYGLVNLPSGRMKTREGTVVDADDLIDELAALAQKEIEAKGRDSMVGDPAAVAEKVALGALHYYLLQTSPTKDMLYDPEQSLSFTGNTGPYIQYMGARACSILRKGAEAGSGQGLQSGEIVQVGAAALNNESDWPLIRCLASYSGALEGAARVKEPSIVAAYGHELAAEFSAWYRDNPVLSNPDPALCTGRLLLVKAVKSTLEQVCGLLCIPFLELM
ncbi:MAG: arginine--tRNA ligase [Spirochaetia bacterium]|jgi:arginyl-tRNA synthetase|nr:arginine--tRNA ligase [Spirochaetales bacterium]MDX9783221.1 arginine--tRNA ligase [Spirochaetia bacterium]